MKSVLTLKYTIVVAVIMLFSYKTKAQETNNTVQKQYWLDYNLSKRLSQKVQFKSSFGFKSVTPHKWNRYWLRPSVAFTPSKRLIKKWNYKEQLIGGVDMNYTQNFYVTDVLEITPYQTYSITIPNKTRVTLNHKLRLDERFELNTNNWSNNFGLRLSYEATLTLRFQGDIWEKGKGFYLPISAKFFYNIKETLQFNDKIRFTPRIGYDFSKNWSSAFLVGYNYSRSGKSDQFENNDMFFRFRVYHRI